MGSFPIVYHLGPVTLTAYGVGLGLTFLFGFWLLRRRLVIRGHPAEWLAGILPWTLGAAVVGARAASVAASWRLYHAHPLSAIDFWHGGITGLSSFGGLAAAVPTALWLMHRRAPEIGFLEALDTAVPALVASWALGRLLACQFMLGGGGPRTSAWYGLHYAGQIGRRVPVPLFQSVEDWLIFAVLVALEHRIGRRHLGLVTVVGVGLWGFSRATDEWLFFLGPGQSGADATLASGLGFAALAAAGVAWWHRQHKGTRAEPSPPADGQREAGVQADS